MSDNILKLIIGISAVILCVILMSGCAGLPEAMQEKQNQLNCEPAESDGCAGWLPKDD
jgi:outer membrane murein-binding lipoprotein Lpp